MSENLNYIVETNVQPYHLRKVANWLVSKGLFNKYIKAYNWLVYLEIHRPDILKVYISEYKYDTDFIVGYIDERRRMKPVADNKIFAYGEDPHMHWFISEKSE